MATPRNDMVEMATARANVYGLLADIFQEEPSEVLLCKLRAPEFSGALHALDLSLDEMFESTPLAQLVEDLALNSRDCSLGRVLIFRHMNPCMWRHDSESKIPFGASKPSK